LFDTDWQNVNFDEDFGMGDTSLDTSPDGEALLCDPVIDNDISISFPEGFFINPFAVSFPRDLPCFNPISMEQDPASSFINPFTVSGPGGPPYSDPIALGRAPAPSFFSPPQTVSHPHPVQGGRVEKTRPISNISNASTKVSSPVNVLEQKATGSKAEVKKSSKAKSNTKYGSEIHFVDMTNKKEAQRIRNTMNSRKHRQNKLEKIRELELKLAALEDEKSTWHDRAKDLGWKK